MQVLRLVVTLFLVANNTVDYEPLYIVMSGSIALEVLPHEKLCKNHALYLAYKAVE